MKRNRCNVCGKFRKQEDLVQVRGDCYDDVWMECRWCCWDFVKEQAHYLEETQTEEAQKAINNLICEFEKIMDKLLSWKYLNAVILMWLVILIVLAILR